jgi:hypothetical protein
MKCHVAAFTLAIWYLVTPPALFSSQNGQEIAPMAQWRKVQTFPSEQDCNRARPGWSKLDPTSGTYRSFPPEDFYDARCVAADDPRLKQTEQRAD